MDQIIAYKFVSHDIPPLENYRDTFPYRMREKLLAAEKLTREEKNRLYQDLQGKSSIHLMGWAYTFSDILPRFWVKYRWGSTVQIEQIYAPDKTSIRRERYLGSHVAEIVLVEYPKLGTFAKEASDGQTVAA